MIQTEMNIKKHFQQNALPDFDILQSTPIKVNGEIYVIVGQKRLSDYLFSHYEIIDLTGNLADRETADKVFKYISMMEITNLLKPIVSLLSDTNGDSTTIDQSFKEISGIDMNDIMDKNTHIRLLLQKLITENNTLSFSHELRIEDFATLENLWGSFWSNYEQRLKALFEFREYIWASNQNIVVMDTYLHNIYLEADHIFRVFSEGSSTSYPITTNIDDLIKIASDLGRVGSNGDSDHRNVLTPFERFSKILFKGLYRMLLWIALPISLILANSDVLSGRIVYYIFIIGIIFLIAHLSDTRARRTKINKNFKKLKAELLSSHPLIKTKYSRAFESAQIREKIALDSGYTFVATPTILWRGMLIVGMMSCLIGIGILDEGQPDQNYGYGWITFGSILLGLRVLLPFTNFGNINFQLTPDGLKRGQKRARYLTDIREVCVNKRGSIFTIDIGLQYRQKFKVKKPYRQDIKDNLEVWCHKNSLYFRDRIYF